MAWLKFIVIGMGFLIVLGIVLLGYGFYKKSSDPDWRLFGRAKPELPATVQPAPPTVPATPPAAPSKPRRNPVKPFGDINLDLPEGCFISEVRPNRRRLLVSVGPPSICNRVYIIDLIEGTVLGTVSPRSAQP